MKRRNTVVFLTLMYVLNVVVVFTPFDNIIDSIRNFSRRKGTIIPVIQTKIENNGPKTIIKVFAISLFFEINFSFSLVVTSASPLLCLLGLQHNCVVFYNF